MSHNKGAKIFKAIIYTIAALLVTGFLLNNELKAGIMSFGNRVAENGKHQSADKKKAWNQSEVPVIIYHHIVGNDEIDISNKNQSIISEQEFAEQMKFLSKNGFKTISPSELYEFLLYKSPIQKCLINVR